MDASTILSRVAGYTIAEFDGEHMIFHPSEGRAIYLSDSASLVWQLCDGQRTVGDITALLGDAYPEAADLHNEVEGALQVFVELRVLGVT